MIALSFKFLNCGKSIKLKSNDCLVCLIRRMPPRSTYPECFREEDFPEKYRPLIRRLQSAIAEPQVRETMEIEDGILEELQVLERQIEKKDKTIEENRKIIEEKDRQIEEIKKKLTERQ